jgi:hypothetical protein
VDDGGDTVHEVLPPTGATPTAWQRAEPRWYGVAPQYVLLALVAAAFAASLVLFATGRWPYGLIVLGVAALLLAVFLEAARRRPAQALGRTSALARERAQSAVATWRARSFAAAEARRARHALAALDGDRRTLLHDLGAAVHLGDATAETEIRARLAELDAHEARLHAQLDASLASAGERIREARLPVEETIMVLPTEPTPPPGEANPPQPATVPEPYPPPDEGTPPQPARVPEPGPDQPRDPDQ